MAFINLLRSWPCRERERELVLATRLDGQSDGANRTTLSERIQKLDCHSKRGLKNSKNEIA